MAWAKRLDVARKMSLMRKPHMWFFDCVSLSNFALSDSLPLLVKRYSGRLGVTVQVADEISEGVRDGYAKLAGIQDLLNAGAFILIAPTVSEHDRYGAFLRTLSAGEASTIAVAAERGGVVVTDDLAARAVCQGKRIPFTGTLGIMQACVNDKLVSSAEAENILALMIAAGFYSPVQHLSDLK